MKFGAAAKGIAEGGHKRWNKDSEAASYLKKALQTGDIDPSDTPKNVYDRYPLFQQYKLESFRQAFNKFKTELVINVRPAAAATNTTAYQEEAKGKSNRSNFSFFCFYN